MSTKNPVIVDTVKSAIQIVQARAKAEFLQDTIALNFGLYAEDSGVEPSEKLFEEFKQEVFDEYKEMAKVSAVPGKIRTVMSRAKAIAGLKEAPKQKTKVERVESLAKGMSNAELASAITRLSAMLESAKAKPARSSSKASVKRAA